MAFPKEDLAKLVLRVGLGLQMVALHGWDKLNHFSARAGGFADPLGISPRFSLMATIAAEVGCAVLLVIGLASRVAAAGLAFTMGVAAFVIHGGDPWKRRELALLYFVGCLAALLLGPGRFSFDAAIGPRLFRRGGRGAVSKSGRR